MRCVRRRRGLRLQWRDGRLARQGGWWPGETPGSPLSGFLELSLERVFGAMAGLREIAIGAVLHGVGIAVAKLVGHGVITGLATFVRLFGTLAAVGIIQKVVAGACRHGSLSKVRASIRMNTGLGYAESSAGATPVCTCKVLKIAAIGKFNSQITWS